MTKQSVPIQHQSKSAKESVTKALVVTCNPSHGALTNFKPSDDLQTNVAHTAEAALLLCQQESFDLTVIDFELDSNPIELARSLRQQFDLRSLFLVQDHHLAHLSNTDDVGAIGFLAGSCNSQHLALAIHIASERARELRTLANRESQLLTALNAEREINTAIGVLMERMQLPRTEAFETLRRYARSQRQQMVQIASKLLLSVNDSHELLALIAATGSRPGNKPV
jgi:AmiR/NasT family two-component response regulator